MTIKVRKNEGVCILEISGKITHGPTALQLRDAVKSLLAEGQKIFILDMAKVPWLDSSAIGEVVACRNRVVAVKGKIRAVLNTKVHDMFTLFELQKVLKFYGDLEKALASLVE